MTAENAERGMTAENEDESWGSGGRELGIWRTRAGDLEDESWGSGVIDWRSGAMTGDLGR